MKARSQWKPVMKAHYNQNLTERQEQFIYGGLLGDLCMVLPKGERRNAHFAVNHSSKQAEYVQFKYSIMKNFVGTPPHLIKNKGWGKELLRFYSLSHPTFTEIYHLCYKNGRKTVSFEWLEKIRSSFALAIWYMDDGSLSERRTMHISTHSFSKEENLLIQGWLRDYWKINPVIKRDERGKGYFLAFPSRERDKFFDLIRPHIIPSMQYKILPEIKPVPCVICGKPVLPNRQVMAVSKWIVCSDPKCREARLRFYRPLKSPSTKTCVICGTKFTTKIRNKITCSPECSHIRHLQKKRENRARNKKPLPPRHCLVCGRTFTPTHGNQEICSLECRINRIRERQRYYDRKKKLSTT